MDDQAKPNSTRQEIPAKPSFLKKWLKMLKYGVLFGFVAGVCALYYGCYEAGNLQCNQVEIPRHVLPGCEGLKIAHLSDIHGNVDLLEKAIDMVIEEKPDLVVITGDFFTATQRITRTRNYILQMQRLTEEFPTYACLGNHDIERLVDVERVLACSNIKLLRNERTLFHCERLNCDFVIAGVGSWLEYDFFPERCLKTKGAQDKDEYPVLLLCHYAIARHELGNYSWNLMLGGHTHGNQIRNPFNGKPFFFRNGEHLTEGYLEVGQSGIYVTRGVGSLGGMRFFCPPEVNILTIQ